MEHHPLRVLISAFVAATMVVVLAPGEAGAADDVGSPAHPVRLSAAAEETVPELQTLATALADATGLEFVVEFVGYEEQAVEWLCTTNPSSGFRIANPDEVVYAAGCGADTRYNLIAWGSSSHSTEFLVPHDSALDSLDELAGLAWYYSDEGSLSSYMVPLGMLTLAGVTDQIPVAVGSHTGAVEAVYDNAVASAPTPVFGSVFTDARNALAGNYPDVFDEVRVLIESPPIPHAAMLFGPTFPAELRTQIEAALVELADESSPDYPTWEASMGALFSATGLGEVSMTDFEFVKAALDASGLFPWGDDFAWGTFIDDNTSVFEADIEWMAKAGITKGCNPPTNDRYGPNANVTRGQMAAFLVRALKLTDRLDDPFIDDDDSLFEADIEKLAAAGITKGCNPSEGNTRFCPDARVTRGQMAAFLVRALKYTDDGGGDLFVDDDGSIFEHDIDCLGTAGVTKGCNPADGNTKFCPDSNVTRGQMAAFLHRALGD
ncbi:MAG: PhnD/SsuA/transferrin family substrate-binding protein [Acidimicrobiia bacterium]